MRKLILKWLGITEHPEDGRLFATKICNDQHDTKPNFRIGIINTMNNMKVLEVGTYSQQAGKHFAHDDWSYEFFAVEPEQKLSDAIALVLTIKGLEK
jgi:hypothetical protein